jgi:hypothetical protein
VNLVEAVQRAAHHSQTDFEDEMSLTHLTDLWDEAATAGMDEAGCWSTAPTCSAPTSA